MSAVRSAHRWWKLGQLGDRARLSQALVDGLNCYESALNAVQVHDLRREQEEREREDEARGSPPSWGPAARQRPVMKPVVKRR